MKQLFLPWLLLLISVPVVADDTAAEGEEAAIRQAISSYVDAFNKADAKGLAGHWSAQGEYVTPDGKTLRGQEQLESEFVAYFTETQNAKLELVGTQVEVLSSNVAVETGVARVVVPKEEPSDTECKVIHFKTADGWKIDSIREADVPAGPPTHYEQLRPLEWMIGTWVDTDENATIETTCRWTKNRNFIARSFKVFTEGGVDFEGTQIIGWDPAADTIRSWMFDSDGGFAVGRWIGESGRWTVQTLNALPDGRRGSATNIYELLDENKVRFRSIGRQVDGELMPNIGPVEVVRQTE